MQITIWHQPITVETLNERNKNTLADYLGITFTEIAPTFAKATMPVSMNHVQPLGILNGGASCALAETVGSTAANYCVDSTKYYCVGLDLNANHLRPGRRGSIIEALAKPIHLGAKTQVWHIEMSDQETQKTVCVARLTMMVMLKKDRG